MGEGEAGKPMRVRLWVGMGTGPVCGLQMQLRLQMHKRMMRTDLFSAAQHSDGTAGFGTAGVLNVLVASAEPGLPCSHVTS